MTLTVPKLEQGHNDLYAESNTGDEMNLKMIVPVVMSCKFLVAEWRKWIMSLLTCQIK